MHIFIGLSPCWTVFGPWSELFEGGDWRAAEVINEEYWCWFDPCCTPQSPLWPLTRSSGLLWQSARGAVRDQWRTGIAGGEMFLCVCVCMHVPTHREISWTLVALSRAEPIDFTRPKKFSSSKNKTVKTKTCLQSWAALPFQTHGVWLCETELLSNLQSLSDVKMSGWTLFQIFQTITSVNKEA